MLAQNFMTAADLKITDHEYASLISVLNMLERGELVHIDSNKPNKGGTPNGFNMSEYWCETYGCIAGWADHLHATNFIQRSKKALLPRGLDELFRPGRYEIPPCGYADIDVAQAAHALRNYLTLGDPRWEEALRSNRLREARDMASCVGPKTPLQHLVGHARG